MADFEQYSAVEELLNADNVIAVKFQKFVLYSYQAVLVDGNKYRTGSTQQHSHNSGYE